MFCKARWRISLLLVLMFAMVGCSSRRREGQVTPAAIPPPAGVVFHFSLENRTGRAEAMSVTVDNQVLVEAKLAPGQQHAIDASFEPGWYIIRTTTPSGAKHQAMVQADKEKWILIRREPRKSEGIGFHVTEYRRKK